MIKLSQDTLLAPMGDVTDLAYRLLCQEYGAGLTCTEMISANGLLRNDKATLKRLETVDEKPHAVQLFGLNKENLMEAAKYCAAEADIIDLNFGCPDPRLVEQGMGSALLDNPQKIYELVKAVKEAVKIPVSCKIRLGRELPKITIMEISKKCEEAGADLITIHARTQKQGYAGRADWSWIKKVKEIVKIPVCGNGDVKTVEDYLRMKKETGCDYVMIGRGAIGNPYIFQQIKDYNEKSQYLLYSKKQRKADLLHYLELADEHKISFNQAKHQAKLFLERINFTREISQKLENCRKRAEIRKLVETIAVN